ncbi:MAG TPA: hypothetical protein VGL62_10480, partial [Vicinamibacterales bacterium]
KQEFLMKRKALLFSLASLCLGGAAIADSPFDGTWQLNPAKSHLAGDTMTLDDAGGGSIKYTDSDQSYTFKPDGSSFTTPTGADRTFQKSADGSYISTVKLHGTLIRTNTWTPSSDGKTMTIESKGTKPNGDSFDDTTTYARIAAGSGILGGWKSTQVKLSSPNSMTIQSSGDDVTLTISAVKATSQAKWDGKDYPATGPTVSDGITLAATKTGPKSFKLVEKSKGKVLVTMRYRVAADGKSMTTHGVNGAGKEPFTEVWDKAS